MPSFLMFTIPMSLLVAILIGLGRLSGDNEITVMKASGISLYQLSQPIAVAAVIAFISTSIITLFLVPQSNYATKIHLYNVSKQKASIGIREKCSSIISKDCSSTRKKFLWMERIWKAS